MLGERKTRSDKKHRQTLRLPPRLKTPVVEMAFNHNISENILICKAIEYALTNEDFIEKIEAIYPAKKDLVWMRGVNDV